MRGTSSWRDINDNELVMKIRQQKWSNGTQVKWLDKVKKIIAILIITKKIEACREIFIQQYIANSCIRRRWMIPTYYIFVGLLIAYFQKLAIDYGTNRSPSSLLDKCQEHSSNPLKMMTTQSPKFRFWILNIRFGKHISIQASIDHERRRWKVGDDKVNGIVSSSLRSGVFRVQK